MNRRRNTRIGARRRTRRRSNPQLGTLIKGGVYGALGAMTYGLVSNFIPVKAGGIMGLGVNLGAAWVTAWIGERLIPGGNSQAFAIGAAGGFGMSVIQYVLGIVGGGMSGLLSPGGVTIGQPSAAQQQALPPGPAGEGVSDMVPWDEDYGMADIVAEPEYWPSVGY